MQSLWQDLRYALRTLAKSSGFTAVAVLTLALGIGANSAIFSVVNAVLLRPLPYREANRVMFLSENSQQIPDMSISMANFNDWREQNKSFENLVAFQGDDVVWTGKDHAERLRLRRITAGFTPTLRVQPILGRTLTPEDDKVGAPRVVVLGEGFWERQFARNDNVLGQQIILDGESYAIVGVFPSRLHGSLRQVDVFASLWRLEDQLGGEVNRGSHPGIYAYGRLNPGVTVQQAVKEMENVASRLDQLHPDSNGNDSVTVRPLLDAIVEDVRPSLLVLGGAVGFVLLIACANIANLLLTRATERHRELAVRMALGAGRGRLIRQMLTESMVLSVLGGTLGFLFSVWVTAALLHAVPAGIPRLDEVSVDSRVLLFTLVLSLATGLFFGIFPALQASRANVTDALKEGGRTGSAGRGHRRLRDALVTAEVGISLVLLVGAGLMAKSLYEVVRADGGIVPEGVGGLPPSGQKPNWLTVVGVVAHVKNYGVDQPSRAETYVPEAQNPSGGGTILVRTAGDPAGLASSVREAVQSFAPDVPLYNVRPLDEIISESSASRRLVVVLISAFAALALTLAAVGIYGVMAYTVTQRSHEIGVRMAMGAAPGAVRRMIVGRGLRLALVGIIGGLVFSLVMTHFIASLLFRVSAFDRETFLAGAVILSIIVLISTWVPARRASRVDPIMALRYE
jgi:ABC-type antimicrobial peptide transport system permease subunit